MNRRQKIGNSTDKKRKASKQKTHFSTLSIGGVLLSLVLGVSVPCVSYAQDTGNLDALEGEGLVDDTSNLDSLEGDGQITPDNTTDVVEEINKDTETVAQAMKTTTTTDSVKCETGKVCVESSTGLALQVLPRPFSNVYAEQLADNSAIVTANVTPFRPLFVFNRSDIDLSNAADPKGWYQVGKNEQQPSGWMQAKDVFEWRQALVVAYTHPGGLLEGRKPVLMFNQLDALKQIMNSEDPTADTEQVYTQIENNNPPSSIVTMEPKRFVDINEKLYILPILNWEETTSQNGDDVLLLQIAAAVPGARGADTVKDDDYLQNASAARSETTGAGLQDLKVDMIFVMDTTRSMQLYIDTTRDTIRRIAQQAGEKLKDKVKFGLVAYRDSVKDIPALEYTAKNFTTTLVDATQLGDLLDSDMKATRVGSKDYAEEVYAGVELGLRSEWRPGAVRLMVVIGDASAHPRGHKQNTTGKDADDLLREIEDANVHVYAVHLADPRAAKDHALAEEQFGILASISGSDEQALQNVNTSNADDFAKVVNTVNDLLVGQYQRAVAQDLAPPPAMPSDNDDVVKETKDKFGKVWEAALVEYIGKAANPPKDVVAWVADRDLTNMEDVSLEVRVLVTQTQLSSLLQSTRQILQAFDEAALSQGQFFEALQSISGQTLKRPEDIAKAQDLRGSGLLPSFISSLPYKSDILTLTNEMYASMTTSQRADLVARLKAKTEQYISINQNVDAWHQLNPSDPDSVAVHPLHIDYLP